MKKVNRQLQMSRVTVLCLIFIITFSITIFLPYWLSGIVDDSRGFYIKSFLISFVCALSILFLHTFFEGRRKRADGGADKLQTVLEESLVGTYIVQGEKIVYSNKRFCDLLGYSQEEVYEDRFLERLIPGDAYKKVMSNIKERLNGKTIEESYSFPVVRKDNQIRIIEVYPKLQTIDGKLSIVGVVIDVTEKNELEKQLEASEQHYKSLFENSPEIVCSFDLAGKFSSVNPASIEIMGRSAEDLLENSFSPLIYHEDLNKTLYHFEQAKKGKVQQYEARVYHNLGHLVVLEVTNFPMIVNDEIVGVYAVATDVTQEKEILRLLEKTKQKFDSLYENTLDAIFEIDDDGNYYSVNNVAEKLTGYKKEQLLNFGIKDLIVPDEWDRVMQAFVDVKNGEARRIEHTLLHKEGYHIIIDINAVPILKADRSVNVIAFVQDITDKKNAEEEIKKLAYKDTLTGLPNRFLFTKTIKETIDRVKSTNVSMGVLFVDFDNFKRVNDTLGHDIGDLLLQKAAMKLQNCVRRQDMIARQGGDEFLIMIEGIQKEEMVQISERMIIEFNNPIKLLEHEVFITPSIGISMFSSYGDDAESLIKHADLAMYLAKEKGKNNYQFYTDSLNDKITRKLQLEHALGRALENKEFTLFYQPQFNITTEEVVGVEALLRWNPDFGFVSPAEFIPVAEDTGLIVDIGKFVLYEACEKIKRFHNERLLLIPISVNVSARQFKDPGFIGIVKEVLRDTQLQPKYLEIEITETVMLDVDKAMSVIDQLKGLGIKIAIDDFGVGYSSLNMIKDIEIDHLKIDQSFLHDVMGNGKSADLLGGIIQMGRKVGAGVIVEGIESNEQVNFLMPYEVIGQGYYYSHPLSFNEFVNFAMGIKIEQ